MPDHFVQGSVPGRSDLPLHFGLDTFTTEGAALQDQELQLDMEDQLAAQMCEAPAPQSKDVELQKSEWPSKVQSGSDRVVNSISVALLEAQNIMGYVKATLHGGTDIKDPYLNPYEMVEKIVAEGSSSTAVVEEVFKAMDAFKDTPAFDLEVGKAKLRELVKEHTGRNSYVNSLSIAVRSLKQLIGKHTKKKARKGGGPGGEDVGEDGHASQSNRAAVAVMLASLSQKGIGINIKDGIASQVEEDRAICTDAKAVLQAVTGNKMWSAMRTWVRDKASAQEDDSQPYVGVVPQANLAVSLRKELSKLRAGDSTLFSQYNTDAQLQKSLHQLMAVHASDGSDVFYGPLQFGMCQCSLMVEGRQAVIGIKLKGGSMAEQLQKLKAASGHQLIDMVEKDGTVAKPCPTVRIGMIATALCSH